MPLGTHIGSSSSRVENGSRTTLKPTRRICSSMLRQFRADRPCGAQVGVSKPNQLTPTSLTRRPAKSTSRPPTPRRYASGARLERGGGWDEPHLAATLTPEQPAATATRATAMSVGGIRLGRVRLPDAGAG